MRNDRPYYDRLFAFIEGLALRVASGSMLTEALAALQAGTAHATWREGIALLRERVDEGETLSGAIWQRRDLFPYLLGVMVRTGEVKGDLDRSLRWYAEYLRQELALLGPDPEAPCPTRQLALWCRRLGMLCQAGIPLLEALESSIHQPPTSDELREAVLMVRESIREGGRLSEKMAEFPDLVPETARQLFATGEETGRLGETAFCLAETLETLDRLGPAESETGGREDGPTRRHGGTETAAEADPEEPDSQGTRQQLPPTLRSLSSSEPSVSPCLRGTSDRSAPQEPPGSALARSILEDAIRQGVSDVHLQPAAHHLRVRFRIDGALRTVRQIEGDGQSALIARLKRMARMDAADRRLPQRGRGLFKRGETDQEYHLRVLTYPLADGEEITLRIHLPETSFATPAELGMTPEQTEQCQRLLREPYGIIAVAGVSGSGRTTTLYTLLRELHREKPGRSILTLENPVEMAWEEINQVSLDASLGLTLPEAMRAAVRQDPDLLMVGEVRDAAGMAEVVQAANRHLVLIGVTATDAARALDQLLEWEPQRAPGHLLGVIAQRLARQRCRECEGAGCDACRQTGCRGRIALFEILPTGTPAMQQLLRARAPRAELYAAAARAGMIPLEQAAAQRVESGVTTPEEIQRVLGLAGAWD